MKETFSPIRMYFYVINVAIVQKYVHVAQNLLKFSARFVLIFIRLMVACWLAKWATQSKKFAILIGIPLHNHWFFGFCRVECRFLRLRFLLVTGILSFSGIGILSGIPRMSFSLC